MIYLNKDKRKINTLELKIEELENIIKNELYEKFIKVYNLKEENKKLRIDNKNLRVKIKNLKQQLKDKK